MCLYKYVHKHTVRGKIFPTNIYKYDEIPEQNYYNIDYIYLRTLCP